MVGKLRAHQVAGGDERAQTHISRVVGKSHIIPNHTPRLAALIVAAKIRPRRYAYHAIVVDSVFHHNVDNSRRKQSAQSTALKYKSSFHSHCVRVVL